MTAELGEAGNIATIKSLHINNKTHDDKLDSVIVKAMAKEARRIDKEINLGFVYTREEIEKTMENIISNNSKELNE